MGDHLVSSAQGDCEIRAFTRAVLRDLVALEELLRGGHIEHGVRRAGVEQEMFLVAPHGRPRPVAHELLAGLDDQRFTSELARFNLEANLAPLPVRGDFLERLEQELEDVFHTASAAAEALGARVLLTGILPTLHHDDLTLENMSPEPRYRQMNDAITQLRGAPSRSASMASRSSRPPTTA